MIKDIKVIKQLLEDHVEVELPYPFKITSEENSVELDYTLKEFSQRDDMVYFKSKVINTDKTT